MQITIEGTVKEVAALVLELQERRRNESEVSNTYACNLVVKDDDISNIDISFKKLLSVRSNAYTPRNYARLGKLCGVRVRSCV